MDSTELLYQKGLEFMQKRQLVHVQSQEEQRQKEINEFVGRPRLCERSRELLEDIQYTSFEDHLQSWIETKNRKIEESKSQIEMTRKPKHRRIKTPPGYTSPFDGWTERVQHYYANKSQEPEENSFMPEINSMSRALFPMWSERIEDRLMRLEEERQKRQEELISKHLEQEQEFTFRPTTNPYDKERPKDVNDYLYKEGVVLGERKKQAAEKCFDQMYSFKPYISEYTRELAKNRKPKDSTSAYSQKNLPKREDVRKLNRTEIQKFIDRNYSQQLDVYKKKLTKPKTDIDISIDNYNTVRSKSQTRVNPTEVADRLIKKKEQTNQKIQEYVRVKEKKELKECTFKPDLRRSMTPTLYHTFSPSMIKLDNKANLKFEDKSGRKYELKANLMCSGILMKNVEDVEKIVNNLLKL